MEKKRRGFTLLELLMVRLRSPQVVTPIRKRLRLFLRAPLEISFLTGQGRSASQSERSFTLLELIIVIGILAILAAIIILVLNPAEFLKRSRDVKRQTDLQSLNSAIVMSMGIDPGIDLGAPSTVYVSLADSTTTCANLGLPALPAGWNYHCAPDAALQKIDGSGWIPVNFASLATGAPLSNLPIDPVNASSSGLYYTYNIGGSWKLTAVFESAQFLALAQGDGGRDSDIYEAGSAIALEPSLSRGGAPAPTQTPTPLYGENWTAKESVRDWSGVAMSSNGQRQTAVAMGGYIYVSTDAGDTWTVKEITRSWTGVAMSSNGQIQTAVAGGHMIYVSADYGNAWTAKESARNWYGVTMSSDGQIQTAVVQNGQIYVSTDAGNTWTAKESARNWGSVAVSSNGQIQTAVVSGGQIYVSTDAGDTWTVKEITRSWARVAVSSNGQIQTAAVAGKNPGQIYVSTDAGNTWTAKESARNWGSVAVSSNGQIQTAVVSGGQIYVSYGD